MERYSVSIGAEEFILSTTLTQKGIKIECLNNNYPGKLNYSKEYSLSDLRSMSTIFNLMNSPQEVQTQIDNAIERQNISITNKWEIIEVKFTLELGNHIGDITFRLPREAINEIPKFQPSYDNKERMIINNSDQNNQYKTTSYPHNIKREVERVVNQPKYIEQTLPAYIDGTNRHAGKIIYQGVEKPNPIYSSGGISQSARVGYVPAGTINEISSPNMIGLPETQRTKTYSSGNVQIMQETTLVSNPAEGRQTQYFMGGCQCPLDHERINNIENATNKLKNDYNDINSRIKAMKDKIQVFKKQAVTIKNENNALNIKTNNLKQLYSQLLEAESKMRLENNSLRKENQGLMLKKNQLDFYSNEQHDHAIIREVNVPFDGKTHRPTAVSKRDRTNLNRSMSNDNLSTIGINSLNQHQFHIKKNIYQSTSPAVASYNTGTYSNRKINYLNNPSSYSSTNIGSGL